MDEKSKQRLDADRAFHRLQSQEKTNDHALSASDIANQARDANTARLRDLRLQNADSGNSPDGVPIKNRTPFRHEAGRDSDK
jgi:hypothetical protein